MLPHVLRFNSPVAGKLYEELGGCIPELKSGNGDAKDFIAYIESLIERVKIPKTLNEAKVPEADLPMLARDAMLQQRLLVNNPREVTEKDALKLYESAWG